MKVSLSSFSINHLSSPWLEIVATRCLEQRQKNTRRSGTRAHQWICLISRFWADAASHSAHAPLFLLLRLPSLRTLEETSGSTATRGPSPYQADQSKELQQRASNDSSLRGCKLRPLSDLVASCSIYLDQRQSPVTRRRTGCCVHGPPPDMQLGWPNIAIQAIVIAEH